MSVLRLRSAMVRSCLLFDRSLAGPVVGRTYHHLRFGSVISVLGRKHRNRTRTWKTAPGDWLHRDILIARAPSSCTLYHRPVIATSTSVGASSWAVVGVGGEQAHWRYLGGKPQKAEYHWYRARQRAHQAKKRERARRRLAERIADADINRFAWS